jgi:integrase
MSRGHGRAFERGPVWWIAYYHRGKEIRESTEIRVDPKKPDRGKRMAQKCLDQRRSEITSNTFIGPQQERVSFATLKALIEQDYTLRGRRSRSTTDIRVKHLAHVFGLDRAIDITAKRIRDYQQDRMTEGAQAATINRELAALHRMFVLATKSGLLSIAACPVFPDRLEEAEPRQGFFEHAEYEAIRAHLPPDCQDVLDFGYLTGWRRREVTGLTWSEVDLLGGVIRLHPARSKSKKPRTLPLSLPLREVIERRAAVRQPQSALVFHPIGFRSRWHAACIKAGLYVTVGTGKAARKMPTKTFHDLRRTAARNYIRSGVSERIAMELLGHRTRTVFDRYNIVDEADKKQAVGKLAYHMSQQETSRC